MASLIDIDVHHRRRISECVPGAKITHLRTEGAWSPGSAYGDTREKEMHLRVLIPAGADTQGLYDSYSRESQDHLLDHWGRMTTHLHLCFTQR